LVFVALLALRLVWALADNDSSKRLEELQFSLAQNVTTQSAQGDQMPTCEELLSEFESDPETQQASPAERQFALAFLQAFMQSFLDQGLPEASRLDPDGNGIACDQLLSGGGGQPPNIGGSQPQPPSTDGVQPQQPPNTVAVSRNLQTRPFLRLVVPRPAPCQPCPTVAVHESSPRCGMGPATRDLNLA
jgi:hypothetical protein